MSLPPQAELRRRAAARAGQFMSAELNLPANQGVLDRFANDPGCRIVEFAHTPHFGHLGFFRMLVAATSLASERKDRVLLLVFNDHVLANALPTIRHIPATRDGKDLEKPPALGVAKADRARPLHYVPAPTREALDTALNALQSVVLYERSRCRAQITKESITSLSAKLFELLGESAGAVGSFSTWCIRSLLMMLRAGEFKELPILVLTGSHLVDIMPEHFAHALDRREHIVRCQNEAAAQTAPSWPEWSRPKAVTDAYFPAWVLCDQCRDVTDSVSLGGQQVHISCRRHQLTHELGATPAGFKFSPKVVLRQPLAAQLGLEHRVCGNRLGYWQVADELSEALFSTPAPARVPITGSVRFEGLAGRMAGAPATLRVLAEMSICSLVTQLVAPHDAEVIVHSQPSTN